MIPRWVIRNIIFPHSSKLEKRVLWKKPEDTCTICNQEMKIGESRRWWCRDKEPGVWVHLSCYNKTHHVEVYRPLPAHYQSTVLQGYKGNLPHWQYKYMKGAKYVDSNFAQCRCCDMIMYGHEARLEHKKMFDPSCCKRLDMAYAELQQVCVVCGQPTTNREWGVPLCRDDNKAYQSCINDWMFGNVSVFIGLQQALYECGMLIPENEKPKTSFQGDFAE